MYLVPLKRPYVVVLPPIANVPESQRTEIDRQAESIRHQIRAAQLYTYDAGMHNALVEGREVPARARERELCPHLAEVIIAAAGVVAIDALPARGIGWVLGVARNVGTEIRMVQSDQSQSSRVFTGLVPDRRHWISPSTLDQSAGPLATWLRDLRSRYTNDGTPAWETIGSRGGALLQQEGARINLEAFRASLGQSVRSWRLAQGVAVERMRDVLPEFTLEEIRAIEAGKFPLSDYGLFRLMQLHGSAISFSDHVRDMREDVLYWLARNGHPRHHLEAVLAALRNLGGHRPTESDLKRVHEHLFGSL